MSIPSARQQSHIRTNQLNSENEKINSSNNEKWDYLIPTIGALALGIHFAPKVPLGITIGIGLSPISLLAGIVLSKKTNLYFKDESKAYNKSNMDDPLGTTLLYPIFEEQIFRGIMQPGLAYSILLAVPSTRVAFARTSLNVATTAAIVSTAAVFGFAHKKNSRIQAINATFVGLVYGVTAARFGLPAAIAAHIAYNTVIMTGIKAINQE